MVIRDRLSTYCSHWPSTKFEVALCRFTLICLKDLICLRVRSGSGENEMNVTSGDSLIVQLGQHIGIGTCLTFGRTKVT